MSKKQSVTEAAELARLVLYIYNNVSGQPVNFKEVTATRSKVRIEFPDLLNRTADAPAYIEIYSGVYDAPNWSCSFYGVAEGAVGLLFRPLDLSKALQRTVSLKAKGEYPTA